MVSSLNVFEKNSPWNFIFDSIQTVVKNYTKYKKEPPIVFVSYVQVNHDFAASVYIPHLGYTTTYKMLMQRWQNVGNNYRI